VRIFPRILPPYVRSLFWTIVLVAVALILHLPIVGWVEDVARGKAVVIVVALAVGGVSRLRRSRLFRSDRDAASDERT
jgi:hypothetical protein